MGLKSLALATIGGVGAYVLYKAANAQKGGQPTEAIYVTYTPEPTAADKAQRGLNILGLVAGIFDGTNGTPIFGSGGLVSTALGSGGDFDPLSTFTAGGATGQMAPLLNVIGQAEAPGGYDTVWGGISARDRPPRQLTTMTVNEVLAWQDSIDPKYQSEAAGRYQVMEDTLRRLVNQGKVSGAARFNRVTQDQIAVILMQGRGLGLWQSGGLSDANFGNNLAREWAGLPVQFDQRGAKKSVKRGQSYYTSLAGNRATVSPDTVLAAIQSAKGVA